MAMKFLGDAFDLHAGGEDLMFPHHENEIAQSESASGKHLRPALDACALPAGRRQEDVEVRGNFYTLRDLLLKGHRPRRSASCCSPFPTATRLNFTFDGLAESTNAIDASAPSVSASSMVHGRQVSNAELLAQSHASCAAFTAALANDLNTAEARAAIFDLVRHANAAADHGKLQQQNVEPILDVLAPFDQVFNVLEDRDTQFAREAVNWARQEGKLTEANAELQASLELTDADIEKLIAERTQAKKCPQLRPRRRHPQRLAAKGILIEDTKDGVRWKRK